MNIVKKNHIKNFKKKKILIVSHDAGGAEIISNFIKNFNLNCDYYIKGPAIKVFKNNLSKFKIKNKTHIILKNYNLIMTGTSLNNNLEFDIIRKASKEKIYTISFLDHWVNYLERFKRKNFLYLPNQIIVGDHDAYKIAIKKFQNSKIFFCKNYFFENIKKVKRKKINNKNEILYFSSNMDSFKNKRISDKKILNYVIKLIKKNKFKTKIDKLIIRKHPSEKIKKFNYLKKKYNNFKIEIDKNYSILNVLKNTNRAIGFDSMALVIAKIYGLMTINLYTSSKTSKKIPSKYIDYSINIPT